MNYLTSYWDQMDAASKDLAVARKRFDHAQRRCLEAEAAFEKARKAWEERYEKATPSEITAAFYEGARDDA